MSSLRLSIETPELATGESRWVELLLDCVSIRSHVRGRIRYHLAFKGDEVLGDTLRRELQKLKGVTLEAYSVRTRNALVTFGNNVTEVEVTAALLRGVSEFARVHGECDLEHHHHERSRNHVHAHEGDDCDHDHSPTSTDAGIRKELLKLVATGGVLGYFVYRKLRREPIVFAGNPLLDVASLVTIISGFSIFRGGMNALQNEKRATDDTLISIAVIATLLMGESITGLSVVWLINLGRLLEAITLKRSRTAIKDLLDIAPKEAWLIHGSKIERVAVEKIKKGQTLRIFESEKVPLDGKVVSGTALVREAFITGEAIPKEKLVGSSVYAGTIVEHGEIDIEVTNLVDETVVAHMIHSIENLRENKAPIEKVGTRFAAQFVPISLGLSAATLIMTGDIRRAITMLVIACPCAAGLATPTAVSASIGQAARRGILIKGGTHIEAAARVNAVIFDKTGTLTDGNPTLDQFLMTNDGRTIGGDECLRLAASAEQYSTHPLGIALVSASKRRQLALKIAEKHKIHPGMGIEALLEGKLIHIGNRRMMSHFEIAIPETFEVSSLEKIAVGESLLFFASDRVLCGAFIVRDAIRPDAPVMLERLRALGIKKIVLASGDHKAAVNHVAHTLGIPDVHAELLPHDKLELVNRLKQEGWQVAMVGDGVNDAQALAQADLSIAMGAGRCDIAIEAADVTLARNDLLLVSETLDISQKTLKTIYQNFVAAVGINAGGVMFGAAGKLSPFSAAIVHNASTIAVVLNSLRLGKQVAKSSPLTVIREVKL